MDTRLQREETLFSAALDIADPASRGAFLDRACEGNGELRARLDELLAAHTTADQYFRGSSAVLAPPEADISFSPAFEASEDKSLSGRVGPYKLLQQLGEGGCGSVFMAEQERPVRRRVALKIIKLGMDTKSVIARFEAERQALALMDHPNIARVLDAGATETGRPFFVMELVRGLKITDFCDQCGMDTRGRLKLFIQVCQAIQHAHQKGIIHRDIKPSNILVTMLDGAPTPKVIDFGIAKATEGRLTDNTIFTAYEQFIGTPAYMSPEQAEMSAVEVDTRSDIYSLGVLLYELLTGRPPFETKGLLQGGVEGMRRTLRDQEPPRPSVMVTTMQGAALQQTAQARHAEPLKLISLLHGDLDWIVMKALEKDRKRRYETANGLAMDVQRFLDNEPVIARPPRRLYRLQKLVRRNRVVFAAGLVVAVTLIGALVVSTQLMLKERGAKQRAEAAEAQQTRLRMEAEDRERIARAAFMIDQGKMQEADDLVDKVSTLQSSLEAESVLRVLGEWQVLQSHWNEASARFNLLLQADQSDRSERITSDLLMAGPIQIERGDSEGYAHFRQAAIARFAGTTNAVDAERTLKISLLLPADEGVMKSLEPFAEVAVNSFQQERTPNNMATWRYVSVALMAYRQNYTPTAIEWCRKCIANPQANPARTATAYVIMALSSYQLHEFEAGNVALTKGRKLIDAQFAGGLKKGSWNQGYWYDWLFARILLRQAEAMVEKAPAAAN
jgi:hypothetical protein